MSGKRGTGSLKGGWPLSRYRSPDPSQPDRFAVGLYGMELAGVVKGHVPLSEFWDRVLPYGLHFLTTAVEAPALGLPRAETSLTKGGVSVLGGVLFPVGAKLQNFLELKYHWVTDYRQFKLNFGIGYRF